MKYHSDRYISANFMYFNTMLLRDESCTALKICITLKSPFLNCRSSGVFCFFFFLLVKQQMGTPSCSVQLSPRRAGAHGALPPSFCLWTFFHVFKLLAVYLFCILSCWILAMLKIAFLINYNEIRITKAASS